MSGSFPLATSPVRLGNTTSPAGPAPRLGADTDAILNELGYDPAAITTLHHDRIV